MTAKEKLKDASDQYTRLKDRAQARYYDPIDYPQDVKNELYFLSKKKADLKWEIDPNDEMAKLDKRNAAWNAKRKTNDKKLKTISQDSKRQYPKIKEASKIDTAYGHLRYWRGKRQMMLRKKVMLQINKSSFNTITDIRAYIIQYRAHVKRLKNAEKVTGNYLTY